MGSEDLMLRVKELSIKERELACKKDELDSRELRLRLAYGERNNDKPEESNNDIITRSESNSSLFSNFDFDNNMHNKNVELVMREQRIEIKEDELLWAKQDIERREDELNEREIEI